MKRLFFLLVSILLSFSLIRALSDKGQLTVIELLSTLNTIDFDFSKVSQFWTANWTEFINGLTFQPPNVGSSWQVIEYVKELFTYLVNIVSNFFSLFGTIEVFIIELLECIGSIFLMFGKLLGIS